MHIQVINADEDSTEQEVKYFRAAQAKVLTFVYCQENNFELYVPGTGDSNSSGCPAQWEENKDAAGWKGL